MLKMKRLSGSSAACALGAWVGYALAFVLLYRLVGPATAALAIIPVLVTARLFGTCGGLLASLLAFPRPRQASSQEARE